MVAQPERVHLSRPGQDVAGFDLSDSSIRCYDLDTEIANSHAPPPGTVFCTSLKLIQ